jgi:hypothetical protein
MSEKNRRLWTAAENLETNEDPLQTGSLSTMSS